MPETGSNLDQVDGTTAAGEAECVVDAEASVDQLVDVGRAARQGGLWSVISYAFAKVFGFASSIVLARFLEPKHFGLIGMTNTVLGMVQVIGVLGISAAIMQQKDDVDEYANTGWWMDVICGVSLFVLSNAIAPVASLYYHEPYLRLLVFVASINFLINPIGMTMDVLLRRSLLFKLSTRITLAQGLVASVFTIILACCGAGVWSFVIPHLIAGVLSVVLRWRACGFRPKIKIRWDLASGIWRFGRNFLGSSVFDFINQNADFVLVGGFLGGVKLGLYSFAYGLGTWVVSNITGTISSVLFPTISSIKDDRERVHRLFLKLILVVAAAGFPIVCIQWAVAPLFISAIYGEKWQGAVTAFRLISIYGMSRAVCQPGTTLISATGRPEIAFRLSALTCPVLVTAVTIGRLYGINGVALATALAHGTFIWFYIIIPFRCLGWNPMDAARVMFAPFTCAVLAGLLCAGLYGLMGHPTGSLVALGLLLAAGGLAYLGSYRLFFPTAGSELMGVLRSTFREVHS